MIDLDKQKKSNILFASATTNYPDTWALRPIAKNSIS